MYRRLLAGVALVALAVTACGPDATGPVDVKPTVGPQTTHQAGDAALAAIITEQLTCLYQKGLLPNEQSSLGKFNAIKAQLAAGDLQGAAEGTANLIKFIELKYSQYSGPTTIDCGGNIGSITVLALKDDVIKNLWSYLGFDGAVCEVPPGQPKICQTGDLTTGFVYFPENIFSQLTFVSIEEIPTEPLQGLFDEHPVRVRILTSGLSDFSDDLAFPVKPLVVVCFNDALLPSDVSIVSRWLLGSNHEGTFNFIPGADFSSYPAEVLTLAQNMCGAAPGPSPFSSQTAFGRFGNSLVNLLLPAKLQALPPGQLSFGGVGGSAEQFSNFGVVDPGLSAFGGVGGSAEQFAPGAGAPPSGPSTSTYSGATSTVVGTAGEVACQPGSVIPGCTTFEAGGLPTVKVVAPVSGLGIPGVAVTFTMLDPITQPYAATPSGAAMCTGQTTAVTGADGTAPVPCLSFGTTVGYKNLQVTFDPTGVDPLACIIGSDQSCNNGTTVNFLVQTTPGAAALIKTYMPPSAPVAAQTFSYGTGLAEGVAVSPAPQVIVTDQYGNAVGAGVGITWSPITGSNGAALVVGGAGSTSAGGLAQVTSWTLGAGLNQILAEITDVVGGTPASFTGSVPTGQSLFACPVGGNKTDIGAISFPRVNGTVRSITLYASVTGQSSTEATYNATFTVRKNNSTGAIVGSGAGGFALPGNNGSPRAITLGLSDVVLASETTGGVQTLWVTVSFSNLPATRKIQVWYNSSITRSNQGPCYNSLVYNPGSTTVFKRGLGINVTN